MPRDTRLIFPEESLLEFENNVIIEHKTLTSVSYAYHEPIAEGTVVRYEQQTLIIPEEFIALKFFTTTITYVTNPYNNKKRTEAYIKGSILKVQAFTIIQFAQPVVLRFLKASRIYIREPDTVHRQ
jgi:hypothetical protein